MRSTVLICLCAGSVVLGAASYAFAGGLLADIVRPVAPKVADSMDKTSRDFKNQVPIYRFVEETSSAAGRETGKAIVTTTVKAGNDIVVTVQKAGSDVVATYEKGWRDTTEQTKRSFGDAVDAGQAVGRFAGRQVQDYIKSVGSAGNRIREGKIVDALWGLSTEPIQAAERNFGKAARESAVINAAAQTAATAYGGPAGAAAYAAWSVYNATGDANLAIRAGILSAATSAAGGSIGSMPSSSAAELLKKSAVAGAIGGIAVAAAGGDENAVKDAFLKSGGAVLVQGVPAQLGAYSPQGQAAIQAVQCISARDVDCFSNAAYARDLKGKVLYDERGQPRVDIAKVDPRQRIGKWTGIAPGSVLAKQNEVMTKISKLPGTQAIPIADNRWVLSWTLGRSNTLSYNTPSVVLTYVGEKPPFFSKVTYQSKEPKVELPATRADWIREYLTPPPNYNLPADSWTVRVWHPRWSSSTWPAKPWPRDGFKRAAEQQMRTLCRDYPSMDFYTWQIHIGSPGEEIYYSVIEVAYNLSKERAENLVSLLIDRGTFSRADKRQIGGIANARAASHCSEFE